ncbi:hypothetical protein JKP88DRAFT_226528, partial [Tribonema minus]
MAKLARSALAIGLALCVFVRSVVGCASGQISVTGTQWDGIYSIDPETQVYIRTPKADGTQSELIHYDCTWLIHTMDAQRQRIMAPSYRTQDVANCSNSEPNELPGDAV